METSTRNHLALKSLLILQAIAIFVYTFFTIQIDGWNFFVKSAEYLQSMLWMGQFSLDFFCYLLLSALWVAWRGKYSLNAIVLALIASVLGIMFLAPYLFYLLTKEKGDISRVLLGNRASSRLHSSN